MVRSSGKALTVCVALLLLAGACNDEDTVPGGMWGRTVEPRLTTTRSWHSCTQKLSPEHVVAEAQCAAAPVDAGRCDELIDSIEQANRMLVSRPQCTNEAIAELEHLSIGDAAAMSDLAGAYYVRAQRKDNPVDLLRAFDASQHAVAARPQPEGAEFNRALILEALSLNADAIVAWQRAATVEHGEWAEEARAHRAALVRAAAQDGEHQWAQVRTQIDAAIDAGDVNQARQLVAAFPATSENYFEEDVLPQWAASPSPQQVSRGGTFAEALAQFFNDRYFADVAAAVANAHSPHVVEDLKRGHILFARARAADRELGPKTAVPLYSEAARLFKGAGSPQYLLADIVKAVQNALITNDYEAELKQLDAVATDARSRRYPSVIARVDLNRIYLDQYANRYGDLFAAYEAAMKAYDEVGDWEDRAASGARAISAMSVVGLKETALRKALAAVRDAPRLLNRRTRQLLIGITARAALDLGHPEAALRYQNMMVDDANHASKAYLAIALRERVPIELRLQMYAEAQSDIEKVVFLNGSIDPSVRRALEARVAQVEGEAALRVNPVRAAATLTNAIGLASKTEYTTFRSMLFVQRAEAYRRIGQLSNAEVDMAEALKQLHTEEERLLREGRPLQDDVWNSYFSRFEETYDLLIHQLIEEKRYEEAFRYADRARAFEPLDLVRKLPRAPAKFLALASDPDHLDIAALRALLPIGTYIIEYRVLEDQTYAWILSRDVFVLQQLTARRRDVSRWTTTLQDAANIGDEAAFQYGLYAPYEALLKRPVDFINRVSGTAAANIVIVPDRELRGLPFVALRNPETKRYFIEDHALTSSGSALLYVFALLRNSDLRVGEMSALLIGDPAFDEHFTPARGLQRLTGARREVDEIHKLYSPARCDVLTAGAATASQFLHMANGHAIIHIAAHGIVNGDAPSQSFLLFAPSGAEHGVLNAAMLIKELHTDTTRLVVLGACSSAGGLPVGAEGIAPLVRPIIGAGVPGVIGALWDIDDATAADLLVSFHRHYRQGDDAAAALRAAQLEMLHSKTPGLRQGLKWAPFQAIGYATSPFAPIGDIKKEKAP